MGSPRLCVQCGAVLSAYALEGVCGNCLLKPGLEPVAESIGEPADNTHFRGLDAGSIRMGNPAEVSRFGDYELLEEIARGGMGIVYRARQVSLDRIVAVKRLLSGPLAGKDFVQRFRTEAAAAASLQHVNIVAIHEVGFAEGQHFFAMDYVEGLTLAQLVAKGPLPARKAATYLKAIAEAIHFAHERNVLHRDLKPPNVIIDSATDQPRVTDFGLAKRLESETELTLSGQLLGSPNYVSPEQAAAKRGTVGKRSDVYSLGAILYHLLTGRPPFQGETLTDVLRQLAESDPPAPRLLTPRVPRDLETICVKCLQKEPSRRYQSARELADDLDRFLHNKPIHARPVTRFERAWRWGRRNPVVATLGLALVLAILIGFAESSSQLRQVSREESIARRHLYTSEMNWAHQAWVGGNLQIAQELLHAHLPLAGKEDLRGFEWRYLTNLCRDESLCTFTNIHFAGARQGLALAADGKTVIAASGDTLKWLDWQKRDEIQTLNVGPTAIWRLTMAVDQAGLVAYRTDRVKAFSSSGQALLGSGLDPNLGGVPNHEWSGAFALSWDGSLLAASGTNDSVAIFDVKTRQQLGPEFYLGKGESVLSLAFSPDANHLACGTLGTKIHILEAPLLNRVKLLTNHTAHVNCLAFDREGRKLASGCNDSHIRIWSFPECAPVADLTGHQGLIGDLAISPDGLRLVSGGSDHTVRLWNLARPGTATFLGFLHGHRGAVTSVLFSRDGNLLYTGSDDGTVKMWDLSSQGSTNILRHSRYTSDLAFSPEGTLVAVAGWDRSATLWQLPGQRKIGPVGDYLWGCNGVKFSPDGKLLAMVGLDETVQIWGISPLKRLLDFSKAAVYGSVAFHPSKPLLAVGWADLCFYDLQNHQRTNLLADAPAKGVRSVVFSPNGNWLALGMENGQVSIWDFASARRLNSFQKHSAAINALSFSRDGLLLASGGDDHRVVLYDLRRGLTSTLDGHRNQVVGLAFAPDDKSLVSTSWDGTIRFWSVANHQVALTLAHDGGPITAVAFSPDGNIMGTSGSDGTARLWFAAESDDITSPERAKRKKP